MAKAFQHVQKLSPKVDFIIIGRDSTMDALEADKLKTQTQWNLFHNILQKENSGQIHLQDEVDYPGIKYYCNGAICGNWWSGSFQEFSPAYAAIELYDDGSSKRTLLKYD